MQTALIFDMDGTLFQTDRILERALGQTFEYLREKGLWTGAVPLEQYRRIMGVPLNVVWETLCPDHTDAIREQSNSHFQQALINEIQRGNGALYPNVETTLKKLSKQFPLFIASNGQTAYLQAIVAYYGLDRWIKKVYSIDCIASKNKSHLVRCLVQEQHIHHGFVIGDRASDIHAALDNGLIPIAVNFDFAQEEEIRHAHRIIEDFSQLIPFVCE